LSEREIVGNVITALNSNVMIAPNYWVDHKTGNDYFLSVQYYENGPKAIHNFQDLAQIPLRAAQPSAGPSTRDTPIRSTTVLGNVANVEFAKSPTEIDHYQIQRVADVYVTPSGEDLGKIAGKINQILGGMKLPGNVRVSLRGMVQGMQ